MFEDDDDFEIDEEFLDGVFDAEKTAIKSDVTLDLTRNDTLDLSFELSPVKRRKSSPSSVSTSSSENKLDSALRTSEESARLIALVSQRRHPSQRAPSDDEQPDVSTSNRGHSSQDNSNFRYTNQVNAPCHEFLRPAPPRSNSPSPNNSPIHRNFPKNTRSSEASFTLNTSRVRQRKFPGPAGLLPDRGRSHVGQRPNFSSLLDTSGSDLDEPEEPLCSQSSASVLQDGPWTALQCDLAGEGQVLLKRYSVAWVKQKAAARQLVGQKVPFLAAVLHSIDCSSPDPCVVLRDSTGEIPGTLHRSVWDSFGGQLMAGSALVLRLVGVLSTGISARRHYLNITSNNILTIYSSPLCDTSAPDTPNNIRKTDVHKWTSKQLLQAADSWEDQNKQKQDASVHSLSASRNPNPFSSNVLNNSGNSRPPLQSANRSNTSASSSANVSAVRPSHQGPARSNYPPSSASHINANSITRPSVTPANRATTSSQNLDPLRQDTSVSKPVSSNHVPVQSRFVPKRPSFSIGGQSGQSLPCSPAASNQGSSQISDTQFSRDLFSDADDVDISSVLDGIDSESLFGDF